MSDLLEKKIENLSQEAFSLQETLNHEPINKVKFLFHKKPDCPQRTPAEPNYRGDNFVYFQHQSVSFHSNIKEAAQVPR